MSRSQPEANDEIAVPDPRLTALRRMRLLAVLLLVAMAVLFLVTGLAKQHWPWLAYPQAFAEAGMVGACADWFAVVALLQRPFGLPIPHTAILPRNKDRIGAAMGAFVVANFLTPKVLSEKLAEIDISRTMARWLSRQENARRVARQVAPFLPRILAAVPSERVAGMAGGLASQGIDSVAAAPLAAHALAVLWDQGYVQATADRVVEAAEAYLVQHKDKIQTPSTARASWWAGRWMDRLLIDRALDGLCLVVRDMRGPDHPWRAELRGAVRKLILELATDREMFARGEAIKADLVKNPALIKYVRGVWAGIETDLRSRDLAHTEAISEGLEYALLGLGKWLEQDRREQAVLNRWVRRVVRNAVLPRRAAIADYIAEVVSSWEADVMIDKLQLEVGRDLQYIRINGTLVGGLVGLLIFTVARQFGLL